MNNLKSNWNIVDRAGAIGKVRKRGLTKFESRLNPPRKTIAPSVQAKIEAMRAEIETKRKARKVGITKLGGGKVIEKNGETFVQRRVAGKFSRMERV